MVIVTEVSHTLCLIWDSSVRYPYSVLNIGLLSEVCHNRCSVPDVLIEVSHTHCLELLRESYSCD
jgi:hypothetical protein